MVLAGAIGTALGCFNAGLIYYFRIVSIVVTIATFNVFFGLLMFFTAGVVDLRPAGLVDARIVVFRICRRAATSILLCGDGRRDASITWILIRYTTTGRQLYAFGDNPDGARRVGVSAASMHYLAFGWMGLMAGIGGLMQVNIVQEVVPNALVGRELDVLAAVVLGGARLGGGRGSVIGCFLGVLLVAITQNGLNLLGVSPFAFKMVIGVIILFAISMSNLEFARMSQTARANP